MNLSLAYTRILFCILCIFFMTLYMVSGSDHFSVVNLLKGALFGAITATILILSDMLFRRFNLRAFNTAIIGLFVGYLMGQALVLVLDAILVISTASVHLSTSSLEILKIFIFLFGLYQGTVMTLRAADELYVTIPFVKFSPTTHKKKDLLLDASVLSDARIIDLASSGFVDKLLIIPRFLIKELYAQAELSDEVTRVKAKRALEVAKKLEAMPDLELRYNDTDFPEIKDPMSKMTRLGRLIDANILTADISRVQIASIEGVKIINIHSLSNSLKPLMQAGEQIRIKIQRYGKEPRQGIGYLEDGTMVVVNGGGSYIGETISAQVLSVKHTTSGRMVFCNAADAEGKYPTSFHDEGEES